MSHDHPIHRPVHIFINKRKYEIDSPVQTGAGLKQLAGIPLQDVLFRQIPGEDEIIGNDTTVTLKNGDHFHSQPPADYGLNQVDLGDAGIDAARVSIHEQPGGWSFLVISGYKLPEGFHPGGSTCSSSCRRPSPTRRLTCFGSTRRSRRSPALCPARPASRACSARNGSASRGTSPVAPGSRVPARCATSCAASPRASCARTEGAPMKLKILATDWHPFVDTLCARTDVESAGIVLAERLHGGVLLARQLTPLADHAYPRNHIRWCRLYLGRQRTATVGRWNRTESDGTDQH